LSATRDTLKGQIGGGARLTFHLAPPFLGGVDGRGRPRKRAFAGWAMERLFPVLAWLRPLRGTWADPFGHSAERRMERQLLRDYEADLDLIAARLSTDPDGCLALAAWPDAVRGFGPVKAQGVVSALSVRTAAHRALLSAGHRAAAE
jgi:indolepyruvate ferredoxin oxidoreductase